MKIKKIKQTMAAYWHVDGLEIYAYDEDRPVKYASGPLDRLHPVKRGLGAKILIVSRQRLMHLRKRYPPAPKEKLAKAVAIEIKELFPLANPGFYCRVFRAISNYVEMDIWAWETDLYERISKVFPFNHVVPEDVLFSTEEPEASVYPCGKMIHMIAHYKEGYLDSACVPLMGFDSGQLERFLLGIDQIGHELKEIKIYGLQNLQIQELKGHRETKLLRMEEKSFPPFMEGLARANIKEFKIKVPYRFALRPALVFRFSLYIIIGYVLMLLLTLYNYEMKTTELRQKIAAIDKKTMAMDASNSEPDYSDVAQEINARLHKGQLPLRIMNMLAQKLPEGSYINRIVLAEDNLEITASSKDPLSVVKAFSSGEGVKKVTLKGSPAKDRTTGLYNLSLILELVK